MTMVGTTSDVPTTDLVSSAGGTVGTDASAIIQSVLTQYGLGSLTQWAMNELTAGASTDQITQDMTTTPQFQARFPGIALRQAAGLPAISPSDYVNYENQMAQMESQYGLPKGMLTNPSTVASFIGNDVSPSEVQERTQQGFQQVAYAPPEVRQFFTQTYGINGDGALAAHFLDPTLAAPLLEQQATAASIGGTAAMGGINMSADDAMRLAQLGQTGSSVGGGLANLEQTQDLYDASVTEKPDLQEGTQGVEAQFGLNATATQEVIDRQQAREAAFKGGGGPTMDNYGAEGTGAAKTA